jgi:hypothetical protein
MQSRIDPRNWEVRVFSRHLPAQVQYNTLTLPADFEAKLRSEYRKLAGLRARDVSPDEGARPVSASSAQSQMRGFGGWLYEKLATENLKGALRDLPELKTIKIYTNNPVLPWELMCPPRKEGGACRFLGTEYAVGRLPLADGDTPSRADPPQTLLVDNLTVIAPSYEGAQALPSQAEELRGLETFPGYRLCPGRLSDVSELFAGRPRGIIHFAGHGSVKPGDENIPEYTINLEDGPVDLMALRDMARGLGANHPLFFFNACSVGQAQQVANTLDGLAPAMLEAGAGGYVGALWPLNDRSAARFGVDFYKALALRLQEGRASVAEVLRDVRRKFLENNDPTFLAYVFYGDPNLTAYR